MKVRPPMYERPYYFDATIRIIATGVVRSRTGCLKMAYAHNVYDWLEQTAAPSWGAVLVGCRIYGIDSNGETSSAPVFIMDKTGDKKEDNSHGVKAETPTVPVYHQAQTKPSGPWGYGAYLTPLSFPTYPTKEI